MPSGAKSHRIHSFQTWIAEIDNLVNKALLFVPDVEHKRQPRDAKGDVDNLVVLAVESV